MLFNKYNNFIYTSCLFYLSFYSSLGLFLLNRKIDFTKYSNFKTNRITSICFKLILMTTSNSVFRFKFTLDFNTELLSFAKIHQYDDISTYKESWEKWLNANEAAIHRETLYLKSRGYNGDVIQKMYRSGRYYFRNKSSVQQEPKPRRKYLSVDSDTIDMMDRVIMRQESCLKPSILYDQFLVDYSDIIQYEVDRMTDIGLSKHDIHDKLKKTYKNRCVLFKNHSNMVDTKINT